MINPNVKRRIKKFLLWTEILIILILGAGMGVVLGAFYQMNKMLPADAALEHYRAPVGTKILSSDGVVLAKLAAENREPVKLDRIPKHMQDAMIAIEDSRFYSHRGLDYRGLTRAVWANISGRELAQGGSTITQQLARNIFLSSRKKISRKIKEILLAVQIERNWSKSKILEAYLNQVYFGAGAYGVGAASQIYFGKKIDKITLEEAAMLAGLPQRPSDLSPFAALEDDGDYDRTKGRRNMVLQRMADLKFITQAEADAAKKKPIKVLKRRPPAIGYFKAKYFVQHVVDELRSKFNYDQDVIDKTGLTVVTSLNWKMQQAAEKVARQELAKIRKSHRVTETSLVCLDPHTGYIRAMVGGVNEPWEKYQFNCATQARRQPGSSFKLFVYTAAFEAGDDVYDSVNASVNPIRMPDGKIYAPKNHGRYRGRLSYKQAFAKSLNGAAVNIAVKVGPQKVKDVAQRLGVKGTMYAYPSLALGVSDTNPLEMANAYGVFAAGGKRAEPISIIQVRSFEGEILEDIRPKLVATGLKPATVEKMNELTRAVVESGTGTQAREVPEAHGKTGTSEDYTDAWFVGYTPDLATAVWAGNRDNSKMARVYGSTIGVPIWREFMKQAVVLNPAKKKTPMAKALEAKPRERRRRPRPKPVEKPLGADENDRNRIRVTICSETGDLASDNCPSQATEEYMLGEHPTARCSVHTGAAKPKSDDKKKEKKPDGPETVPAGAPKETVPPAAAAAVPADT